MAQIAVNVGMNLRVLPVIGVTLPFYSAGGSSVLMLYICVGLVLSVYTHNTKSCSAEPEQNAAPERRKLSGAAFVCQPRVLRSLLTSRFSRSASV